jgi:glutamyl-tRNA synthetase
MAATPVTRLAPSPTGALHLGNARTFLINWLLARASGWRIVLRIEDLDGPRVKRGADQLAIEDLRWLGLDWDEGPTFQSSRNHLYADAAARLLKTGHAYPCVCSRREATLAASAPHAQDRASIYPGTCRDRFRSMEEARALAGRPPAVRFRVPDEVIDFDDAFCGRRQYDAAKKLGDFVIAKSDGTAAYQLAVVIDDATAQVTQVVRGDDLLDSVPRQMLLYRSLDMMKKIPRYTHLPLVVGSDGRRLAKRHGDTRLVSYRDAGVSVQRVLALLARWCGIEAGERISIAELRERFSLANVPGNKIVMTQQDDTWLRSS